MIERPSVEELLEAVSKWLAEGGHRDDFAARVFRNAVETARRELEFGAAAESRARNRMVEILGCEADYAELNAALATAIREGRISASEPEVFAHLKATALDMIAIDQPRYRHELKLRKDGRISEGNCDQDT